MKLTAQSMKLAVPRIAKTMTRVASRGTDLINVVLTLPARQEEAMWESCSWVVGGE